jgi:membrane protein required for colicin V production
MIIDVVFLIALVSSIIRGYQKGFIVALFSFIAWIAGLVAALKLSAMVAVWLGNTTNIQTKWLPLTAFVLVFILTVLLIRLGAKMIEGIAEFAFLGWVNKALGILLYMTFYGVIFSVLLFFTSQLHLFSKQVIDESVTYQWIEPWAPELISRLSSVIPFLSNMFEQLKEFFQQTAPEELA